jgi:rod shape-determining protein MreD
VNPWRYALVLLVTAALAPGLRLVSLGGVTPDLLLVVALFPALRHGFRAGYLLAWVGGLLVDCQSLGAGIPHSLLYLLAAYGVSLTRQVVRLEGHRLAQALSLGAAALALDNLGALALWAGPGAEAVPLLVRALAAALYTALVTPLVYLVLEWLPLGSRPRRVEPVPLGAAG